MVLKFQIFLDGNRKHISNIMAAISIFSQSLLTFMVIIQVLMRYVFHSSSLFGIEELEMYPIFWMYFISGVLASSERTHIECGLYEVIFKGKQKVIEVFDFIKLATTLALSIVASVYLFRHFYYILTHWKPTSFWRLPSIYYEAFAFIGFTIMAFISMVDLLSYFINKMSSKSTLIKGDAQ